MNPSDLLSRFCTRALAAGALWLGASNAALAYHSVCVHTAAELQQALTDASDGGMHNGEDNIIGVAAGTYQTGAATSHGPFFFNSTAAHYLEVEGYDNDTCEDTAKPKAGLAILDGDNKTGVLTLRSVNGSLSVVDLVLQNGESDEPGAGAQINYLVTVGAPASLYRNIIRNNHSTVDAGGLYSSGAGTGLSLVTGNVIYGNSADGQYGAGYITGYGAYNEQFNNTITRNTSAAPSGPVGGLACGGSTSCIMVNNIFWNNTGCGLDLIGTSAFLDDNDYGTLCGNPPADNVGHRSTAPKFVDSANDDFHLSGDSPLLGVGSPEGFLLDTDGNAFPESGKSDVGAYSETIFDDGFDGD